MPPFLRRKTTIFSAKVEDNIDFAENIGYNVRRGCG